MMATVTRLGEQAVPITKACAALNVPRSSYYSHQRPIVTQKVAVKPRPTPPRALSAQERRVVRETLESERFVDQSPREVYATLLDEGSYLCSPRTMYRVLDEHGEVKERRNQLRHPSIGVNLSELLIEFDDSRNSRRKPKRGNHMNNMSKGHKC